MLDLIRNWHNWRALPRALWIMRSPLTLPLALLRRRAPAQLSVRTPIGTVRLALLNVESLKTFFSIFCREDYPVRRDQAFMFADIGANIGLASAYFLSRNKDNKVICFEPDPANLDHLRANLAQFAGRAIIRDSAVAPEAGSAILYRSADGKHSSLVQSARARTVQPVTACSFASVLRETAAAPLPTVVKLDVEGMEPALLQSVSLSDYPHVCRLVCEHWDTVKFVSRPHRRVRRNSYIDDLIFEV